MPPTRTSIAVAPWMVSPDADALLRFLTEVFGAEEAGRVEQPDGTVGHAETRIGDATLVVASTRDGWAAAPAYLRMLVPDLAGVLERGLAAGVRVVTPPTPLVQGDVMALFADPWDNLWWLVEHVEDVPLEELLRRMEDPTSLVAMRGVDDFLDAEMRSRRTAAPAPSTDL